MTKGRYNPKTIGDYRRNYQIDNNLFLENESDSQTGCHMRNQRNRFFYFLLKTCTFVVLASTWQNSDKTHTTSTFGESWVKRRRANEIGVRLGRLLIGDTNISLEPCYALYEDREADVLGENYHSSKKRPQEIFLRSNFQNNLDYSLYNNKGVGESNMQARENGNNSRSMTSESFDSLSFSNDFHQANDAPNDKNELGIRFDTMEHCSNFKGDIYYGKQDESSVNRCTNLENSGSNDNNKGHNPNYNSMINAEESFRSPNVSKAAGSSNPGEGDHISSEQLGDLKNYNNFKENCDETQDDEDFKVNYSSLQFDCGESRTLDNFKYSGNMKEDVPFDNMQGSNRSSSKQFEVPSVNVSFDKSHDTLKEYSDFKDKVNKIKMDSDFTEGFYSLKGVSNVNASFGKITGDINGDGEINKNDNVSSGCKFEQNYKASSNNEDSERISDLLKHYNDFKGEANAETFDDKFEKGYMTLNPDDGVNTQVKQQGGDAKEVNEITDELPNEDNFENIFEKYRRDNHFKKLHSSLMRTANTEKHFDKINDDYNYDKKYDILRSGESDVHNSQGKRNSDENNDDHYKEDLEQILNLLKYHNAFKEQVNEDKIDNATENGVNILTKHDIPRNGVHPSKSDSHGGKKKSGNMNGRNNANRRFQESRIDLNSYNNPVNRSPNGGRNYKNRNNGYRNYGSNAQNPLDVFKNEQDYSNENLHIFNGMSKFGKEIYPSRFHENNDNEQPKGSKTENDESDHGEYADDEYEDEHVGGECRRYNEGKKHDYGTQGVYRYYDNRINILRQDKLAPEFQKLEEYKDNTEVVTTMLESTGNSEEQFGETLKDVVNVEESLDVTPGDNTNAIEQYDGTLKDNVSLKEQLNVSEDHQDNKQFGKSKDEERGSIGCDELDDDRIICTLRKSECGDERNHVTYKSRKIGNTNDGAIDRSKMAADKRNHITEKLKRIDDRDSDIHDHSRSGERNSDKKGDTNDKKRNEKNSFIDGNSKNDDNTSVISDKSMGDRNKKNSHTYKKDNAKDKGKITELINTDNYHNKHLNDIELMDDFNRMFNILQNSVATKERFEALEHYEMLKKEILNIQLEKDFEHVINKIEHRTYNKGSLYAPKEEYGNSCDSSRDEDYFDSQYDRLMYNDRNRKVSNMKKKDNYSDCQSDILGRNNRDKKELNMGKGGKRYEDTDSIRDHYNSEIQYNVSKKECSLKKSVDKSNINTDYYNYRSSFDVSKNNKLSKAKSDKSKDDDIYYGSRTSLGVRGDSNNEKRILNKISDHDNCYYGSKYTSISSKVNNDVAKKCYNKSRGTTDKCETRSLYSVLSRNRSRRSLDKGGAPSNYYSSKTFSNESNDNKVDKNISYKTNTVCHSGKQLKVLRDAKASSKGSVNKINNEEKGNEKNKVDSHFMTSFYSLEDYPLGKYKSYNSLKSDQSNLDDLYDELDDAYTLNKRYQALKCSKEGFYVQNDDVKYDEKKFGTAQKTVERCEKVGKKKSNKSRKNDKKCLKSRKESEMDIDFWKSCYTFKRRSFASKISDLLERNDKPIGIEETFRHDRNYKDSSDKAKNNRENRNRKYGYSEGNNRRDDNERNHNRRNDINDNYEMSLVNIKRNKKSSIKKVFSYIGRDEDEPSKSRKVNGKFLFLRILKFIKKIDFMFELEIMKSVRCSIGSDTFLIKPETNLNKLFYYTKKCKIYSPVLLTLICLFIFYLANLHNVVLGIGVILLGMMLYYSLKLLKCHKMREVFRTFSETNKFRIS
ncbi:Plasmodium exported protein, unknown function [Plasmodium knowlesi strain H]|uniref:Pv-fam-d protein n=3 Tax=Plasmodium knowlesi TaxID=5850 RepID=A0A1A7VVG7_PLAKH|nr:Plasmodium exported protein, unknown function [Plasmodium knowlesi strain H]OTN68188.1 Uncharacterized protein PKNOH_S03338600 [Plasmodium knowlesi]CAA9987283.1 Plasmodium exported protein, unknown function [Plasmodium knowlesi strain H]SBO24060.1 Plasmodium exported protein, unknown function [Plasmodium knowlesi strain H]SBO26091.1 Plasmodium exported protein, unknown function [Plasmodium knowlesi strain H]VVS76757.1 Plasmodium exported protein, unknown function [Plasmodium knowlesi strain